MAKIDRKKADPEILRSYLDVKHDRWLHQCYPFIMLGGMLGAIVIVALMFVVQPRPSIGGLMALGAVLVGLTPYAAMVFLTAGRYRAKILLAFVGGIIFVAVLWSLLSWLAPNGHF